MSHSPGALVRRLLRRKGAVHLALLGVKLAFAAGLLLGAFVVFCQWLVLRAGAGRFYINAAETPAREVGVVLGTSERLGDVFLRKSAPTCDICGST